MADTISFKEALGPMPQASKGTISFVEASGQSGSLTKDIAANVAGVVDTAWNMLTMPIGAAADVGARMGATAKGVDIIQKGGDPNFGRRDIAQVGREAAQSVTAPISSPFGRLMRVMGYGDEYDKSAVNAAVSTFGSWLEKGQEWIEKKTGGALLKEDVALLTDALSAVGPEAALKVMRTMRGPGKPVVKPPEAPPAETPPVAKPKVTVEEAKLASAQKVEEILNKNAHERTAEEVDALRQWADRTRQGGKADPRLLAAVAAGSAGGLLMYKFGPELKKEDLGLAAGLAGAGWIKAKGGMWHPEAVNRLAEPLQRAFDRAAAYNEYNVLPEGPERAAVGARIDAIEAWPVKAVRNWLNKHAGTETDPLKNIRIPMAGDTATWESVTDQMLQGHKAKSFATTPFPGLEKVPAEETVWTSKQTGTHATAFKSYLSHVGDYLREFVPAEKLQQYDLVRAVRETAAQDAKQAAKMAKAGVNQAGTVTYKQYPDGMKWVEVGKGGDITPEQMQAQGFYLERTSVPGNFRLGKKGENLGNVGTIFKGSTEAEAWKRAAENEKTVIEDEALLNEGDVMGHCVGGYCEAVHEGSSKIYSLRDSKGMSHVTVEVLPPDDAVTMTETQARLGPAGVAARNKWSTEVYPNRDISFSDWLREYDPDLAAKNDAAQAARRPEIAQIKGKQNRAPVAQYLPYVQDFVKSGKWGEVGDLENAGLVDLRKWKGSNLDKNVGGLPKEDFITQSEFDAIASGGRSNQRGSIDPKLLGALAAAGTGAAIGAAASDDPWTGALGGAGLALAASSSRVRSGVVDVYKSALKRSPMLRASERTLKNSLSQMIRVFNPDILGKRAEGTAAILASNMAKQAQKGLERTAESTKRVEFWNARADVSRLFLFGMERGAKFKDPEVQAMSDLYRRQANEIYNKDQAKGIEYEPVDNYVYHLFEDPKGAAVFLSNKYGSKWGNPKFTKERSAEFISEAEKAGFRLKTSNPEEIMQARLHASDIAHMKIDALRQLAAYELARPVRKGDVALLDETVWRSPNGELYFLKDHANQVMHNAFNTTSLWAEPGAAGALYRGAMYLKNAIVPIKLLSLFHPLHVQLGMSFADPLVAMTKRVAGGTANFGDLLKEGLRKAALTDVYTTPKHGWEMMKAFRGEIPEKDLTLAQKTGIQYMVEGGFIPELATEFKNQHVKDFKAAIAEHSAKAAWHLPFAIMEKLYTKPVFEQWIPAIKTAAYLRAADAAVQANPALLQNTLARMQAFRKLQKMVDDRFGEMQYKTLFTNRLVKDAMVGSFLSYGWQLGFIRSYVGAVPEASRAIVSKIPLRETIAKGELDKALFVGYYTMGTMLYGGLLTYGLTGDLPRSLLDYIYPRSGERTKDGKEARLSTPFYTREFISIPKHIKEEGLLGGLATTVGNKLSPAVGVIKALATNSDFLGREISDPEAPIIQRTGQKLKYLLGEMEPMATSAAKRTGQTTAKDITLSTAGFSPAPRYVTETEAEGMVRSVYMHYKQGRTPYEATLPKDPERKPPKEADSYVRMFKRLSPKKQLSLLKRMPVEERERFENALSKKTRAMQ